MPPEWLKRDKPGVRRLIGDLVGLAMCRHAWVFLGFGNVDSEPFVFDLCTICGLVRRRPAAEHPPRNGA